MKLTVRFFSFACYEYLCWLIRWDCSLQDKLLDHTSVTHLFPIIKYLGLLATDITGMFFITSISFVLRC